ncbi:MAG: hypothetical protein HOY71_55655, partial [Nonomuraea sp.]|nr:hypothetical protein [Nonomuraea sp.]
MSIRNWALVSGLTGIAANLLLVLFYVTARPWEPGADGNWLGTVNDYLVAVQFATLAPVAAGLRVWTRVSVGCCAAIVVLQVLLVTGVLPFEVQVAPVGLCIVTLMVWVGAAGRRTHRAELLARFVAWGAIVGGAIFLAGFVVVWLAELDGPYWVLAALPAAVAWMAFPLWPL